MGLISLLLSMATSGFSGKSRMTVKVYLHGEVIDGYVQPNGGVHIAWVPKWDIDSFGLSIASHKQAGKLWPTSRIWKMKTTEGVTI